MKIKYIVTVILGSLILAACASVIETATKEPTLEPTQQEKPTIEATSETIATATQTKETPTEEHADSGKTGDETEIVPEESPPAGAQQQFITNFSKHTIPYSEILSGGPPKDGIPAIDNPKFVSVAEANAWLKPEEPVIAVVVGETAKAYPLQILTWHEIVNDTVDDLPLTITFCPLCNTGIAFEREFNNMTLDFGTTGRLRFSNLIMYDRQTETWWQQATGEGIAGDLAGEQLVLYPASMLGWQEFKTTYSSGLVLSQDTGFDRPYGKNPYVGYDDINSSPFLFIGPDTPDDLPAMARVLTIEFGEEAAGYPYDALQDVHVVNDNVGGTDVVIFWAPGTSSALDASTIAEGRDVGSANAFKSEVDSETLTFAWDGEKIVDEQTGSEWTVSGLAVVGAMEGTQLEPVVAINHFWFSWAAFKPETRIYQP